MKFIQDTLGMVGLVFNFIFALWPFILVQALAARRRNIVRSVLITWGLFFVGWLLARAISMTPLTLLIPEPLNTILFFLTGLCLIMWVVLRDSKDRQMIHTTADTAQSPRDLLDVSPSQFEKMVVEFYRLRGYEARRTGSIGDHGVDVIINTPKGSKWVVQCKRWRGSVGEPPIRDFYGTVMHEKADRGILITTGTFSNQAREWAKGEPLALVDGEQLLSTWKEAKRTSN